MRMTHLMITGKWLTWTIVSSNIEVQDTSSSSGHVRLTLSGRGRVQLLLSSDPLLLSPLLSDSLVQKQLSLTSCWRDNEKLDHHMKPTVVNSARQLSNNKVKLILPITTIRVLLLHLPPPKLTFLFFFLLEHLS